MKLVSPAFADGQAIPPRYTDDGDDLSPELQWADVPHDAVSLALIREDPDAPRGAFTYWVMWNLDPGKGGLGTGETPVRARPDRNEFGTIGYCGPGPPPGHGTHHDHFALAAISRHVPLPEETTIVELRPVIAVGTLTDAEIVGADSAQRVLAMTGDDPHGHRDAFSP